MLTQLNLYLMIDLFAVCLILGGGWCWQSGRDAAIIDTLKGNAAKLELSVELNEKTIEHMVRNAQTLAAANQTLTNRIVATEVEHVEAWQSIDALDLVSDAGMDDVTGLEMDSKETLAKSIDGLRAATGR
ncbi:hypothetical protein F4695_000565 [Rhizobium soli]|uniref:Uncharacterized protein n=1 Tax=Rhizobium soli TaxID=424798 RepID=A0A7X0JGN6_9HYPH|nr:hypothetical protein [Rhizobium soli]MBB6507246.1 hypothetical protein [Rhizobium soli]